MLNRNSILLLATLIISNVANAALNDTGIKTCSNATQNGLPCPFADFSRQDMPNTAPTVLISPNLEKINK